MCICNELAEYGTYSSKTRNLS